jgi:hypothetical protein
MKSVANGPIESMMSKSTRYWTGPLVNKLVQRGTSPVQWSHWTNQLVKQILWNARNHPHGQKCPSYIPMTDFKTENIEIRGKLRQFRPCHQFSSFWDDMPWTIHEGFCARLNDKADWVWWVVGPEVRRTIVKPEAFLCLSCLGVSMPLMGFELPLQGGRRPRI